VISHALPGGHAVIFERRGRTLCGRATIYTRFGPVHLSASTDIATARAAMRAILKRTHGARLLRDLTLGVGGEFEAGGFFDDVGNFFKKGVQAIAKNKVFREIEKGFHAVMSNPITGPLLTAIPYVGPALQVTAQGAHVLAGAYSGDPQKMAMLKKVFALAKRGNVKAIKAARRLQKIRDMGKKFATDKPTPAPDRVHPKQPTRLELVQALRAIAAAPRNDNAPASFDEFDGGESFDDPSDAFDLELFAALQSSGEIPASRVDPSRYARMKGAYQASGYRIGESGLPIALVAGADGVHRLPPADRGRQLRSSYGYHSTYGLRLG
jgi:hypothetical protein